MKRYLLERFFVFINVKAPVLFLGVLTAIFLFCSSNRAPSRPVIIGRDHGFVSDTISICIYAVDPEDNVITYWIEWGDTTSVRWSPFFQSGETIPRTHVYCDTGVYFIRAKARDIDRAESDWSDTFTIRIEAETVEMAPKKN
ncbi:MAG: hypothetical protein N2248_03790 [candidate division WOR-3 bacterium]|uniref:PKD domain-containing protein n=1 Tax=candidate division WOR-3 bacterium TaxID=2052148 RepID=A0A7C1SQI9_UNCW3|nr:hypothetical protein [candidate division WOR-3 bacterium]